MISENRSAKSIFNCLIVSEGGSLKNEFKSSGEESQDICVYFGFFPQLISLDERILLDKTLFLLTLNVENMGKERKMLSFHASKTKVL